MIDKMGRFRLPMKSANKNLLSVMQKLANFVGRFYRPTRTRSILDDIISLIVGCSEILGGVVD